MILASLVTVFVLLHIICDINYFVRTLFFLLSSKIYQRKYSLDETTSVYGICTFQDCNIRFNGIRIARLLRELDFARYHFYERTGIYRRTNELKVKFLQGSTFTITMEDIPLFCPYKINTKLVNWDDRSLYMEHKVITMLDGKVRCLILSRQHEIRENGHSSEDLLAGLPGSNSKPDCPEFIKCWLRSMEITSKKLRIDK